MKMNNLKRDLHPLKKRTRSEYSLYAKFFLVFFCSALPDYDNKIIALFLFNSFINQLLN